MKKPITSGKFVFFFAAIILLAKVSAFAQENQPFSINNSPLPPPTGFVNDYAGVIDAATKQQLEAKLKNLKDTTNPPVEIAVAVVKTTGERDIFDYSLAVARGWKIGSKDDDNPSALLLIAIDDRKYFTQVSKDLEDELPDGTRRQPAAAKPRPGIQKSQLQQRHLRHDRCIHYGDPQQRQHGRRYRKSRMPDRAVQPTARCSAYFAVLW